MSKRKVLIFGATGEIGSRIANLAVRAGHEVIGVTRGRAKADYVDLSGIEFRTGDKYDESFLATLSDIKPDAVIDSIGCDRMIPIIQKYFPDAENVLFCSSTGSYVPLQYFPADENHPWQQNTGLNFFHQCEWDMKALAECEAGRFPITILRPTNIIGETRVPLELWGGRNIDFYKTLKEGRTLFIPRVRDVMVQSGYNWDLASAFVKALEKGDAVVGEIFNISCRKAITLGEFLNTAVSYLNSSSEIVELSDEDLQKAYPGKISMHYGLDFLKLHMCFDMCKAETILGYDPQVTAQEGLIRSLRWLEENGKL